LPRISKDTLPQKENAQDGVPPRESHNDNRVFLFTNSNTSKISYLDKNSILCYYYQFNHNSMVEQSSTITRKGSWEQENAMSSQMNIFTPAETGPISDSIPPIFAESPAPAIIAGISESNRMRTAIDQVVTSMMGLIGRPEMVMRRLKHGERSGNTFVAYRSGSTVVVWTLGTAGRGTEDDEIDEFWIGVYCHDEESGHTASMHAKQMCHLPLHFVDVVYDSLNQLVNAILVTFPSLLGNSETRRHRELERNHRVVAKLRSIGSRRVAT
jgi:hypothetical protein